MVCIPLYLVKCLLGTVTIYYNILLQLITFLFKNVKLRRKKKSRPSFSDILGQPEKGKQTSFFRPNVIWSSHVYAMISLYSNSDDNMLRNIEMFDKLSVRFNGRVIFVKDVIGGNEEICCWSFYGLGRKVAEISCTSIVYTSEKKQTKVSEHPFLLGGTHLEKGYRDVRPLRPPFHALSQQFPKTPFQHVWVLKEPLFNKNHKSYKNCRLEPNFTQNFRSKASNLAKIQFFKPYFFKKFSL